MKMEFEDWNERDQQLYNETDWKARNYEELPVEKDIIDTYIIVYGVNPPLSMKCQAQLMIRPNSIYPPYYKPILTSEMNRKLHEIHAVGPMFDGESRGKYDIHNRYETQELYDMMSN